MSSIQLTEWLSFEEDKAKATVDPSKYYPQLIKRVKEKAEKGEKLFKEILKDGEISQFTMSVLWVIRRWETYKVLAEKDCDPRAKGSCLLLQTRSVEPGYKDKWGVLGFPEDKRSLNKAEFRLICINVFKGLFGAAPST